MIDMLGKQEFGKTAAQMRRAHNITPATFHIKSNKAACRRAQKPARLCELEIENPKPEGTVVKPGLNNSTEKELNQFCDPYFESDTEVEYVYTH